MNNKSKAIICLLISLCYITSAQASQPDKPHNHYTLSEVVVFSRHNIRAPLSERGSKLGRITPHQWYSWSSCPSHLSLKGGVMETMMGQYFHEWLVKEGKGNADGDVEVEVTKAELAKISDNPFVVIPVSSK